MSDEILLDEELLDFMVANAIYPMYSKKGKVYLRCSKKGLLTEERSTEIIRQLNISTAEECEALRREIKTRVAKQRTNRPIKEWTKEERPREMLLRFGPENLATAKLLAIILRTGREGMSAEELGRALLNEFGSLRAINSAPISEISKIEGIGLAKAVQIKAAFELGKRFFRENAESRKKLNGPDDVIAYVSEFYAPYLRDQEKEFFSVILLDVKNKPIENVEISRGSVNTTVVDPKEVVKAASLKSASSVILVHNHPSGETTPSSEDVELTSRISYACDLVGVNVLDHIIVGKNPGDFYSFAREGLILN